MLACQTCSVDPLRNREDILDRMCDETIALFTSLVSTLPPRRENGKMTGVIPGGFPSFRFLPQLLTTRTRSFESTGEVGL
jgi:hypothetical protein